VKRFLAIAIVLSAFGFGMTAWAGGGGSDQGTPASGPTNTADESNEAHQADQGLHGGPIERLHIPGTCDLVSIGGSPGNWTHGDYVAAVVALGDPALVVEAAHSECGKPMKAAAPGFGVTRGLDVGQGHGVGHGLGPPAHALEHAPDVAKVHQGRDDSLGS
jgi:hypothetical protein